MKTRFCPSPTGSMHIGNARTALFNALLAKGKKGIFLLRIEDTDTTRSTEAHADELQHDLKWLGTPWQEGPGVEGPQPPYWQSQRSAIYAKYYETLEKKKLAYPCFCTEQALAIARKIQLSRGQPPRYSGTCLKLTSEEIQQKIDQGLKPALRFHVQLDKTVIFVDLVRGEQNFSTNDIGDFIIRRADGSSSFIFCNAIDDALMGVTHALRGEDHLTNTPRQILILQALRLSSPTYGHISLILGSDGSPLSKRNGSRSIKELRDEGYLPEALVNYMARLGHYYAEHHFMSFEELAEKFSVENLGSAPARYDDAQLLHWQREAIIQSDAEHLWEWMGEELHQAVPSKQRDFFINTVRTNVLFPREAMEWARVFFGDEIEYESHEAQHILHAGKEFFRAALAALENHGADFKAIAQGLQETHGVKGKALYQPLRVAITGVSHGPEMVRIIELLGKEKVHKRLAKAQTLCSRSGTEHEIPVPQPPSPEMVISLPKNMKEVKPRKMGH